MKENMTKAIMPEGEWEEPKNGHEALIALAFLLFMFLCGICFDHWFLAGILHI
jgi:hypothetical protein